MESIPFIEPESSAVKYALTHDFRTGKSGILARVDPLAPSLPPAIFIDSPITGTQLAWNAVAREHAKAVRDAARRARQPEDVHQLLLNYAYAPLSVANGIRLLTILPGAFGDRIEITLLQEVLDDSTPAYEALSYVWGETVDLEPILCDGMRMEVTANLAEALRYLRVQNAAMPLWVDAVCINQHDQAEKAQQVTRMGDIYSRATNVIAWLGPEDEWTPLASTFTRYWANYETPCPIPIGSLICDKDDVRRMQAVLNRVWFTRCWTYQEMALARDVELRTGIFSLSIREVTRALWLLQLHLEPHLFPGVTERLSLLIDDRVTQVNLFFASIFTLNWCLDLANDHCVAHRTRFSYLLMQNVTQDATNERDKVYSLLGFANEQIGNLLKPDYSLTVDQVYIQTAKAILTSEKDLAFLAAVDRRHQDKRNLPTWVPCWSAPRRRLPLSNLNINGRHWRGMRVSPTQWEPQWNADAPNELPVCGIRLDRVKQVLALDEALLTNLQLITNPDTYFRGRDWRLFITTLAREHERLQFGEYFDPETENSFLALMAVLWDDMLPWSPSIYSDVVRDYYPKCYDEETEKPYPLDFFLDSFADMFATVAGELGVPYPCRWPPAEAMGRWAEEGVKYRYGWKYDSNRFYMAQDIAPRVLPVSRGRALFVSEKGSVGITCDSTRPGDTVWVLYGGCAEYILRPKEDGKYEFVSECSSLRHAYSGTWSADDAIMSKMEADMEGDETIVLI